MGGLKRDGTAEPVSRGQILKCEVAEGKKQVSCSADLGIHTRLIHTLLC